jgi:hypothetical protein
MRWQGDEQLKAKTTEELTALYNHLMWGDPGELDRSLPTERHERGFILVQTMGELAGRYPFSPSKAGPEGNDVPLWRFQTDEAVMPWLDNLERSVGELLNVAMIRREEATALARDGVAIISETIYAFQALIPRDFSRIAAQSPMDEFIVFLERAQAVAAATRSVADRLERYRGRLPRPRFIFAGFLVAAAAFICGVVWPMLDHHASMIVDAWIPASVYVFALLTAGALLLRHYRSSEAR